METQQTFEKVLWQSKSLNRTMQYGNERTMQIARQEIIRLNRTMQYGNDDTQIIHID